MSDHDTKAQNQPAALRAFLCPHEKEWPGNDPAVSTTGAAAPASLSEEMPQAPTTQKPNLRAYSLSDVHRLCMRYDPESLRMAALNYEREGVRELLAMWGWLNRDSDPRGPLMADRAVHLREGENDVCALAQEAVLLGLAGSLSVSYALALFKGAEAHSVAVWARCGDMGDERGFLAGALRAVGVDAITDADEAELCMLLALGYVAWFGHELSYLARHLDLAVPKWRQRWPDMAAGVVAGAEQ